MSFNDLNFCQLLHLLNNDELKNKITFLEKQHKQILSAKSRKTFNQTCLTNIFTNI